MRIYASSFCIFSMLLCSLFGIVSHANATESSIIKNVVKIKIYEARSDGSFVFTSYGSAIAISPTRILTNAHVIAPDGEPTGLYEICLSNNFESVPICRDIGKLIAYDTVLDLALLELSHNNSLTPFTLSTTKLSIGSYVSMYGYPSIGGETITRTDGKIAGYEQTMYKIDGSIDHGNSGGAAFNNSGELVGVPTAVAADNASIGYMIPVPRIRSFLTKRTDNYELYTTPLDTNFIKFLKRNQVYTPNKSILKWNGLIAKNPRPFGFFLKSSMVSSDNTMMSWLFGDAYERVKLTLSCTDDAGGILGWEARREGFVEEKKSYPTWNMSMVDDEKYFTIYASNKGYKPTVTLYYKEYDACFAEVEYSDAKKDAKTLEKALKFLKSGISFNQKYTLKDTQKNKYFQVTHADNDTRVIRSIDLFGSESILLGFKISERQWINATIEGNEYASVQELGTGLGIDMTTSQTLEQYLSALRGSGVERDDISIIELGSGKKGILITHYNPEKKTTSVTFQYIYKTSFDEYAYWSWSSNITGDRNIDLTRFKKILASFVYPGEPIFP